MPTERISLSVPNVQGREIEYVTDALSTGWVSTAGSYVSSFEESVARFVGAPRAVACQSGTAALYIALLRAGVQPDDAVLVPTLTFIAAVNPVKYVGAHPVLMDCDDSLCLDPVKLERYCKEECAFSEGVLRNRETGRAIKAIVVVHVFGNMADMVAINDVARRFNLRVIEDATEALGTKYTEGPYAGRFAGTLGDFGVFSFNGNKIITTGGGGMIIARRSEDSDRAAHLTTQAKSDSVRYEHDEVGYNYRLTNVQAAIGVAQMECLERFIDAKNDNYNRYQTLLRQVGLPALWPFRGGTRSNKWFYSLPLPEELDRDRLMGQLAEEGIQTRPIWGLIHEQAPYADDETYAIEQASRFRSSILNLPCSTSLTEEEIVRVVEVLKGLIG